MKPYVNLHNHTLGSLLDGISKIKKYVKKAKEDGNPAVVATEHGNMFSVLDMQDAAKAEGIQAIPGEEFYEARKTRFDQDPEERAGKARNEWDQRGPHHLTVLAVNNTGYKNLVQLSSRAYTEGYFGKPRIDTELLSQHADGLVVLSGCLSGKVQQALLRGDPQEALRIAGQYQEMLGKSNYFIEIMDHGIGKERECHDGLIEIAKKINAPIVATCDSHYTYKEQAFTHDVSLCINTKSLMKDENRFRFGDDEGNRLDEFYLKTYDEMAQIFPTEWIDNTMLVYEMLDLDLSSGEYHIPEFPVPEGTTRDQFFLDQIRNGAEQRFGKDWEENPVIKARLDHEINVVRQMGFENYFLVVADILGFAHDNGILTGPSRGSVGGSLLAYCMFITEIDPIKFGLSFDRFLVYKNPVYEFDFPHLEHSHCG